MGAVLSDLDGVFTLKEEDRYTLRAFFVSGQDVFPLLPTSLDTLQLLWPLAPIIRLLIGLLEYDRQKVHLIPFRILPPLCKLFLWVVFQMDMRDNYKGFRKRSTRHVRIDFKIKLDGIGREYTRMHH